MSYAVQSPRKYPQEDLQKTLCAMRTPHDRSSSSRKMQGMESNRCELLCSAWWICQVSVYAMHVAYLGSDTPHLCLQSLMLVSAVEYHAAAHQ